MADVAGTGPDRQECLEFAEYRVQSQAGASAPGYHGTAVDQAGPAIDVIGQSDPWEDLWFYSNPIFATTER